MIHLLLFLFMPLQEFPHKTPTCWEVKKVHSMDMAYNLPHLWEMAKGGQPLEAISLCDWLLSCPSVCSEDKVHYIVAKSMFYLQCECREGYKNTLKDLKELIKMDPVAASEAWRYYELEANNFL